MKKYKRPLTGHHEEEVAIVRYPDGIERTLSRNIAEMMVETHPEEYSIMETRPKKRSWRHR